MHKNPRSESRFFGIGPRVVVKFEIKKLDPCRETLCFDHALELVGILVVGMKLLQVVLAVYRDRGAERAIEQRLGRFVELEAHRIVVHLIHARDNP